MDVKISMLYGYCIVSGMLFIYNLPFLVKGKPTQKWVTVFFNVLWGPILLCIMLYGIYRTIMTLLMMSRSSFRFAVYNFKKKVKDWWNLDEY